MDRKKSEESLDERARQLLRVLVTRYIRDGHPVGSRTLSKDSGLDLSAATVRNVMSDLEDLGFIASPHTSAGRVPTDKGYRLFVDTLIKLKPPTSQEVRQLEHEFSRGVASTNALVASACDLLSAFTRLAGVVTVPKHEHAELMQIEFLPLSNDRVLAILVLSSQEVQNRILHLSRSFTEDELREAANYLNAQFAGRNLADVRESILEELKQTRKHMNRAMIDAIQMAQKAMEIGDDQRPEYVIAGETNLMDFAELSDVEKLRRLFEAFNRQRDILHLLDQTLKAHGVQIIIGHESGYQILDDCSVVTAPYGVDDQIVGVLGVIGPTRMAYERVIPIVDITAKLLGAALNSRS
ncbi:MAG: heat-inducible transcriptional repressor HrcA [Gammaproteobacteria bacterium]